MNITRIAGRLRDKLSDFSGILSQGFGKVEQRFIHEVIYGVQTRQSVRVSEIARSLNENIPLKKTMERLSTRLARKGLAAEVADRVIREGATRVGDETLLILDPTDITKRYAEKMEYLAKVHDGSEKKIGKGYWMIEVIAAERGERNITPLYQSLYSQKAPGFDSENTEILNAVDAVGKHTGKRGIWVIDRGGDRLKIMKPLLKDERQFIIRMRGDRHVFYRGRERAMIDLAQGCPLPYADRIVKEVKGHEIAYNVQYGFRKIKLPWHTKPLHLLVVTGFGQIPLMLLTTIELRKNRTLLWSVLESYLTRWRIEETIRFIKQSYDLEDIRVLTYERLKNMMALVLAAVYFASVYLGARSKLEIMATHILKISKRIFGIPDFRYYALADGIGRALSRIDKGPRTDRFLTHRSAQLLLFDYN